MYDSRLTLQTRKEATDEKTMPRPDSAIGK